MRDLPAPPVLLITDRHVAARPLEELAAAVFAAGVRWLLLRDKDLAPGERRALARRLAGLARAAQATLTLAGDDADLAREVGAAGLHLARGGDCAKARVQLGPDALIGLSAHDQAEAEAAFRDGADYVTLSPILATPSKPGYGPALGLERFAEIAGRLPGPVLALGGVTAGSAAACMTSGAAGIAVMGALLRADDPSAEAARLISAITQRHAGPPPASVR